MDIGGEYIHDVELDCYVDACFNHDSLPVLWLSRYFEYILLIVDICSWLSSIDVITYFADVSGVTVCVFFLW